MKQLIDKSDLIADIRSFQDSTMDEYGNFYTAKAQAEYNILCYLENHIDTLEVKEVDEEYNGKAMLYVLNKGVEQGKREMLDKVCEWLLNNVGYYSTNALGAEYMCEDLRKAMEG